MVTGINESKTLTKYISCTCNCNFDGRKRNSIKSGIKINVGRSAEIQKKHCVCEKYYIWNPGTCSCENDKYVESITDDSLIMCDEIIDTAKTFLTKTVLIKF